MAEIIVALDVPTAAEARRLVSRLGPDLDFVKVGLELFTREGPPVVRMLRDLGLRVFLDLKLHDIPHTVAAAVRAARELDVELLTVHASGGPRMLAAAAEAADAPLSGTVVSGGPQGGLRLLAVTVLTSLASDELAGTWGRDPDALDTEAEVLRLAALAAGCGIGGVVASPREAPALRTVLGAEALLVTPGIRFAGGERHDQARVATPGSAVAAGASHLVLGRAVTSHADPASALSRVRGEVRTATSGVGDPLSGVAS
ncbi:MAG: orotidine-5'-phosphate decarboxylase [Gemmatimonadales bacterium]|nr:MAG: orotidine-5'-phosphate decarboxylase [Gemmatimonadales bacterium]